MQTKTKRIRCYDDGGKTFDRYTTLADVRVIQFANLIRHDAPKAHQGKTLRPLAAMEIATGDRSERRPQF
jgi:hypothetical protein